MTWGGHEVTVPPLNQQAILECLVWRFSNWSALWMLCYMEHQFVTWQKTSHLGNPTS